MLRDAYLHGVKTAFARFKIAIPLSSAPQGAAYGVGPSGDEMSHGTATNQYPQRARGSSDPAQAMPQDQFNADWLWKNQDLEHMAPGGVSGYGEEVLG